MKKISIIKTLIFILQQEKPEFNLRSGGLIVQAVHWHHEIKDMFRIIGVPENDINLYTEDYVNRVYMLKIKNTMLYFPIFFLICLILSTTGTIEFSGVTQRGTSFIPKDCMFFRDKPVLLATKIHHDRTVITDLKNPNHLLIQQHQNMVSISITTLTLPLNFQIPFNKIVIHFYSETNNKYAHSTNTTKNPSKKITKKLIKSIFILNKLLPLALLDLASLTSALLHSHKQYKCKNKTLDRQHHP